MGPDSCSSLQRSLRSHKRGCTSLRTFWACRQTLHVTTLPDKPSNDHELGGEVFSVAHISVLHACWPSSQYMGPTTAAAQHAAGLRTGCAVLQQQRAETSPSAIAQLPLEGTSPRH